MDGFWLLPRIGRRFRKSNSNINKQRTAAAKPPRGASSFGLPIFELTPLEQRVFLSFAPSIGGPTTALGGQPYTLNLTSTGTTTPVSWTINWGDGNPAETVNSNPSTWQHTYANTAQVYTITATAKNSSNVTATAQPLGLDVSFNSTGKVLTDFTASVDGGYAMATDANGKIVVAGIYNNGDFVVARYLPTGVLDTNATTGFGPLSGGSRQGWVKLDFSGNNTSTDKAFAVGIQSWDGKIVVAGTTNAGGTTGFDFALARFTSDGTLDTAANTGFGPVVDQNTGARAGTAKLNFSGTSNDQINAMAIQNDHKIVVAGYSGSSYAIARFTTDGVLDTTFNSTGALPGTRTVAFPSGVTGGACQAILLENEDQAGQKIVLGGYVNVNINGSTFTDFGLTRLNGNGSLDDNSTNDSTPGDKFGLTSTPGFVRTDFTSGCCSITTNDSDFTLVLENDGSNGTKIVAAGSASNGNSTTDFAAARYSFDGLPDTDGTTGFGPQSGSTRSGKVTVDFNGSNDVAYGSAVSDGKIVLVGSATASSVYGTGTDFALVRLNRDGTLDSTFGNGGKLTTDFSGSGAGTSISTDAAHGIVLLSDGRMIVAGAAQVGSNQQFALAEYQPTNQVTAYAMPNAPANFKVTAARAGEVDLTWDAASGATGYVVERSTDQTNWTPVTVATTSYSDTVPLDGGTYYYRIRASNSHGNGLATGIAKVQIGTAHSSVATDSFETPAITSGTSQVAPAGSVWAMVQEPGSQGASGVANHSPTLYATQSGENPPDGQQEAYLTGNSFLSQSAYLSAGHYTVQFSASQVAGTASSETIQVLLDGTLETTVTPGSGAYGASSLSFDVSANGTHTLQFVGSGSGDAAALIDAVTVIPAIIDIPFNAAASGWTTAGGVTFDANSALLTEADGLESKATVTVTIPPGGNSSLVFQYSQLGFDAHSFMNDAFEASLTDSNGTVFSAFQVGHDALMNVGAGVSAVPTAHVSPTADGTGGVVSFALANAAAGPAQLTFRLLTNDTDSGAHGSQVRISRYTGAPGAKFYVADSGTGALYRYGTPDPATGASQFIGTTALPNPEGNDIRGAATSADGQTIWTIDKYGYVYKHDASGTLLGKWQAAGQQSGSSYAPLVNPKGITTDGTNIWIVDAGQDSNTIDQFLYRYDAAASFGNAAQPVPPSHFTGLFGQNTNPTDIAVGSAPDGKPYVWIPDSSAVTLPGGSVVRRVYRYDAFNDMSPQGHWQLNSANADPQGITISHGFETSDAWVLDGSTKKVYHYIDANSISNGNPATLDAHSPFALNSADAQAQAIALVDNPSLTGGSISGGGSGGSTDATFGTVPVGGNPAANFANLTSLTSQVGVTYQRTSFNDLNNTLFTDVQLTNNTGHTIEPTLLAVVYGLANVGVDPSASLVSVVGATGTVVGATLSSDNGLPYVDLSPLLPSGGLAAGQSILVQFRFSDPPLSVGDVAHHRFTFDLHLYGTQQVGASISGHVYADQSEDLHDPATPVHPIKLQKFTEDDLGFSVGDGIAYYSPDNALLIDSQGGTHVEELFSDLSHRPFSDLFRDGNEARKISTASSLAAAGFLPGDVLLPRANGIERITNGGTTTLVDWAKFRQVTQSAPITYTMDQGGTFGGNLIVMDDADQLWMVDGAGNYVR